MIKKLTYLLFALYSFTSCEEIYHPAINMVNGHLIVDALVTNDLSQNYVHLSESSTFYDSNPPTAVTGASVKLLDSNGNAIQGIESSPGFFNFKKIPEVGQNYKLQISLHGDIYESETETMPPMPSLNKFYTERVEKEEFITNATGVPVSTTVVSRALYLDAPITAACANYRFVTRAVMEWVYVVPNTPMAPTIYGWQSLYNNNVYNIAGPKKFSQNDIIEKHQLMLLPYNTKGMVQSGASVKGWIFILNQYGTSIESFDYHEKLNSQLTADDNLLDPVQTQVFGNITCKTDSSKIVFGYFDLNSTRQYRYFISFSDLQPNDNLVTRELTNYPEISIEGKTVNLRPEWWE
jgi:hypothetical protein